MKRKAYLLLELLIAFSILSLCIVPLVRNPMHTAKQEIYSFERMEVERLAELAFAELLEKLYSKEIPLKAFEGDDSTPFFQDKVKLNLPGILKRTFKRQVFIWTKTEKQGTEQNCYKLVNAKVTFQPLKKPKKFSSSFTTRFFIEIPEK